MAIQKVTGTCCIVGVNFINATDKWANWIVDNEDYTNQAIAIYTVLRSVFFNSSRRCSVCSLKVLCRSLGVKTTNYDKYSSIRKCIELLRENGYIKLWDMFEDIEVINIKDIDLSFRVEFLFENDEAMFIGVGGFVRVPEQNINILLAYIRSSEVNIHKYQLIRYYLMIARICSNDSIAGYITQDKIRKNYKFADKTCKKYNTILAGLGLIFYNNSYIKYNKEFKKIISGCTFFGHRNIYNKYGQTLSSRGWDTMVAEVAKKNNYRLPRDSKESNILELFVD